jgi:hypothetical protein
MKDNFTTPATSNVATVTVAVAAGTNPVAVDDAVTTNAGATTTISVLTNDTFAAPATGLKLFTLTPATGGTATPNLDGTITYRAPATTGTYTFTYSVQDNAATPRTSTTFAKVTVTVLAALPPAPTITSPVGIISSLTPAFTFNPVAGATGYAIHIHDFTTGLPVSDTTWTPAQGGAACVSGVGPCSVTMATPLINTHSYAWAAAAVNAGGQGPYSAGLNFSVNTTVVAVSPIISSPVGTVVSATPVFTFSPVAGATGYAIHLHDFATGTATDTTWTPAQGGAACVSGVGPCSITMATPLINTHSYVWVAAALNAAGQGPYSAALNFNVAIPAAVAAPTITAPVGAIVGTTPVFTFNPVVGATGYAIHLHDFATGTATDTTWTPAQGGATCVSGVGPCSITMPTPLISTHSYVWVAAGLSGASQGPWSTTLNFNVQ